MNISADLFAYHHPSDLNTQKLLGNLQKGVKYLVAPKISLNNQKSKIFYQNFLQHTPQGPDNDFLMKTSHDAIMIIIQAINEVGNQPSKVKEYLLQKELQGVLGNLKFNHTGDLSGMLYQINQI